MNEERWILAILKRKLTDKIRKDKAEKGYVNDINPEDVLRIIAEIEAEAVLGAPTEKEIEEVE